MGRGELVVTWARRTICVDCLRSRYCNGYGVVVLREGEPACDRRLRLVKGEGRYVQGC